MKEIRQSVLIGICLSSLSAAQGPEAYHPQTDRTASEIVQREFILHELEEGGVLATQKSGDELRAQALATQLRDRMNHIAVLWKDLVQEYTTKNSFNIRTARELSKAFRQLEHTECWPKPDREK